MMPPPTNARNRKKNMLARDQRCIAVGSQPSVSHPQAVTSVGAASMERLSLRGSGATPTDRRGTARFGR